MLEGLSEAEQQQLATDAAVVMSQGLGEALSAAMDSDEAAIGPAMRSPLHGLTRAEIHAKAAAMRKQH